MRELFHAGGGAWPLVRDRARNQRLDCNVSFAASSRTLAAPQHLELHTGAHEVDERTVSPHMLIQTKQVLSRGLVDGDQNAPRGAVAKYSVVDRDPKAASSTTFGDITMAMQEDADVPIGTAGRAIEKASPRVFGPLNDVERFFEQRIDQAAWHELPAEMDQTKAETRDGMLEATLAKAAGANNHDIEIA